MRYIIKLVLFVFVIAVYSCRSKSNKQNIDSAAAIHLKANANSKENLLTYTNLIFPGFTIKLHNFGIFNEHGIDGITDSSQVIIQKDDSKHWSLTAKSDTINLIAYDFSRIIELIPKTTLDKYKISYAWDVTIYDPINNKIIEHMMSDYRISKDSLDYFFKLPESASDFSDINENIDKVTDVKRKLKLKDTIVVGKNGQDLWHKGLLVTYKDKISEIGPAPYIYLKFERINKENKLIDTKFLKIEIPVGESGN